MSGAYLDGRSAREPSDCTARSRRRRRWPASTLQERRARELPESTLAETVAHHARRSTILFARHHRLRRRLQHGADRALRARPRAGDAARHRLHARRNRLHPARRARGRHARRAARSACGSATGSPRAVVAGLRHRGLPHAAHRAATDVRRRGSRRSWPRSCRRSSCGVGSNRLDLDRGAEDAGVRMSCRQRRRRRVVMWGRRRRGWRRASSRRWSRRSRVTVDVADGHARRRCR